MTNLVQLQEKVEAMIQGEKKRRETALKFLEQLQKILKPVAEDIWGEGEGREIKDIAWIRNKKDGKNIATNYYFRYDSFTNNNERNEWEGIYKADLDYCIPVWGTEVEELRGKDFWNAIRCIIEWIPILIETLDNRNNSRDQLISLININ